MPDFEKLGVFYLGRERDLPSGQSGPDLLLYDSRDLTTHAVVVGMTGSGKTGLCVTLLEEAALDRIPALVIDPKGDIANLLLTFPNLSPEDFLPWIDESQASRAGMSPESFAAAEAEKWKRGLAEWGQDGARIQALRDSVEMRVYTPGGSSARPLAILQSLAAPPAELRDDEELLRERIATTASGLLALLRIDADPIRSREHILIATILEAAWSAGKDLDIAQLIARIQTPEQEKIGVMPVDSFFPPADRQQLAVALNNLLASPAFAGWREGEPLDIRRLLHTDEGKPCISILSIAHLPETQRLFFVTILLNEVLAWTRRQSGTSSLRAILYMDEVFGYFPPTANPPPKRPMLTLLKQARAYGLGIVLATQNPVDLDYKGLSNTGTWFLGRMQTERDKLRVLEGLEGASAQAGATFNRAAMEATLAGLGSRVFLMNNVHEDHPVVFETRWAMSYLRGPLTRAQLRQLCATEDAPDGAGDRASEVAPETAGNLDEAGTADRTTIPAGIEQLFVADESTAQASEPPRYRPALLGACRVHFVDADRAIDTWREELRWADLTAADVAEDPWERSRQLESLPMFQESPVQDASFAPIPAALSQPDAYPRWKEQLQARAAGEASLVLWWCGPLEALSRPGETQGEFRVRLEQHASEKRDQAIDGVRQKHTPKLQKLNDRIRRAAQKVEREKSQYRHSFVQSLVQTGSTVFGALFGRKLFSVTNVDKASTSMRSFGRTEAQRHDVAEATEKLETLQSELASMDAEVQAEIQSLDGKWNVARLGLDEVRIPPRKSDTSATRMAIVWVPQSPGAARSSTAATEWGVSQKGG